MKYCRNTYSDSITTLGNMKLGVLIRNLITECIVTLPLEWYWKQNQWSFCYTKVSLKTEQEPRYDHAGKTHIKQEQCERLWPEVTQESETDWTAHVNFILCLCRSRYTPNHFLYFMHIVFLKNNVSFNYNITQDSAYGLQEYRWWTVAEKASVIMRKLTATST